MVHVVAFDATNETHLNFLRYTRVIDESEVTDWLLVDNYRVVTFISDLSQQRYSAEELLALHQARLLDAPPLTPRRTSSTSTASVAFSDSDLAGIQALLQANERLTPLVPRWQAEDKLRWFDPAIFRHIYREPVHCPVLPSA